MAKSYPVCKKEEMHAFFLAPLHTAQHNPWNTYGEKAKCGSKAKCWKNRAATAITWDTTGAFVITKINTRRK